MGRVAQRHAFIMKAGLLRRGVEGSEEVRGLGYVAPRGVREERRGDTAPRHPLPRDEWKPWLEVKPTGVALAERQR